MHRAALLFCAFLPTASAVAQFYAPQTDFHDPSQRFFPVEAARVMAWRSNAAGSNVAEVTWGLSATAASTSWTIEWRDTTHKTTRKATVRYDEKALLGGADWYRSVWKQLGGGPAAKAAGDQASAAAFWEGVEAGGLSRMDAISAAQQTIAADPKMEKATDAARLSGTLVAAALPSVGSSVSLDPLLLARSAAWLCAAEEQAGPLTQQWAPIMALAGRVPLARKIWQKPQGHSQAERFCDLLVRFPVATEALSIIAQPENRHYAGPLLAAYNDAEITYGQILATVGKDLCRKDWDKLHDYGPTINFSSKNKLPFAPDFPAKSFRAWLDVLGKFAPSSGDDTDAPALAQKVKDFPGGKGNLAKPGAELIDLLNRSLTAGEGPLIPVSVVTARDLLNFGWDMGALQVSNIHNHLSVLAGQSANARALGDAWPAKVNGWDVFFLNLKAKPAGHLEDTSRYEIIASGRVASALIKNPPNAWGTSQPDTYFRRRWLVDCHRALEFHVQKNGPSPDAVKLLRKCVNEGGPAELGMLLTTDPKWRFPEAVDALDLRSEIARAVPMSVDGARVLLDQKLGGGNDPLAYAQALERAQWSTGLAFAAPTIFLNYVRANALDAASRYYDRSHAAMVVNYDLEARLGPARFALALLQKDEAARRQVMADCGTTVDRRMEIADALLRDDFAGANQQIDEWIKRWHDPSGAYTKLRAYLPLVPALCEPKHADHARAVAEFPKSPGFLFLQWVLITKAGLPVEEATAFLGRDEEVDSPRYLILAGLRKDRDAFRDIDLDQSARMTDVGVVIAWLRNELLPVPPAREQPDLKPANAVLLFPLLKDLSKK